LRSLTRSSGRAATWATLHAPARRWRERAPCRACGWTSAFCRWGSLRLLDLYVRIVGLGQLEEVLGIWSEQADARSDRFESDRDALQHAVAAAKRIGWGFALNQSRGIHSDAVPEDARRAYDVRQVLRHAIATERMREARAVGDDDAARWVEMSVDMRSYSPVSSHPAAKVETVREGDG
jgi:hypothetical protein